MTLLMIIGCVLRKMITKGIQLDVIKTIMMFVVILIDKNRNHWYFKTKINSWFSYWIQLKV